MRLITAVLVASLVIVPGATAAPAAGTDAAIDALAARLAPARARADAARAALDGSVMGALRALAAAGGRDVRAPMVGSAGLRDIVAAVVDADRTLPRVRPADLAAALAAVAAAPRDRSSTPALAPVDPGPALRAAARIAATVDVALPNLRRMTAVTGAADAECDVLDQMPTLCVGGLGANRYERDATVLIDLGGDDVHANHAGGLTLGGAALVLDLGGNDRYEAPANSASAQSVAAAGATILADLGGNDVYLSVGPGGLAQGYGVLGGAALLFDASGNDRYTASGGSEGGSASIQGQGGGALGGVGGLVDPLGNDFYLALAEAFPKAGSESTEEGDERPITSYGGASVTAQGFGVIGGAGLLLDPAGNDVHTVRATIAPSPADAPPIAASADAFLVHAGGQGSGLLGGAGFLLLGSGTNAVSQSAIAGPLPASSLAPPATAFGQGAASVGGIGVLSDAGSEDSRTVSVRSESHVAVTARAGCGCTEPLVARSGSIQAQVQGQGLDGAIGLLDDGNGFDANRVVVSSHASLEAHDDREGPAQDVLAGSAVSGSVLVWAQGTGLGPGGLGAIWDEGNSDVYSATGTSEADVVGDALIPENEPVLAAAPGPVTVDAQAVGAGADGGNLVVGPGTGSIVDFGGADTYAAHAYSLADGVPQSAAVAHAQASVDLRTGVGAFAHLFDIDLLTSTDSFAQTPPLPACTGTRGGVAWADCNPAAAGITA